MKNVIILLAVIAMAAPLYGDPCDVVFTGDGSTGSLVLSYTTNNGALPRGVGLKCEVLDGDTVDVDSDAVVADPCFNTFIDYAFMDPDNFTIGAGHPMADPCFAGVLDPCTGVDVFSICMGALDQTGNQFAGPATSDPLVSVPLDSVAASVTIRISEDDLRGGVVGSALTTNLPIDVVVTFDCFPSGYTTYADWVTMGKPACWCTPYQCDGDADVATSGAPFNYRVYNGDLTLIWTNWKKKINDATLNPCADIDHLSSGAPFNYRVYNGDLGIIWTNWKKKSADLPGDCPRPE